MSGADGTMATMTAASSTVPYAGEIAALTTAVCWSLTSIFFTMASARLGAIVLNRWRLVFAIVFLGTAHVAMRGQVLPPIEGELDRWILLGLSGIIGLSIGDGCLFAAFTRIGPRKSMILMSTVPILTAIIAWVFLGESLSAIEIAGIFTVVGGVILVVAERSASAAPVDRRHEVVGVIAALGGAVSQAVALVIAKEAMAPRGPEGAEYPPLSATLVRMIVSCAAVWLVAIIAGDLRRSLGAIRNRAALPALTAGSVFGPFLGVWLSLVAIHHARVGIASSLMALVPVFVIPWVVLFFRERVSLRAIVGTVIAVAGVVVLLSDRG